MFVWVLGFILTLENFKSLQLLLLIIFMLGQEYESNDYISKLRGSLHPSQPSQNLTQEMISSKKATSN